MFVMREKFYHYSSFPSEKMIYSLVKKVLVVDSYPEIAAKVGEAVEEEQHNLLGIVDNIFDLERRINKDTPDIVLINLHTKNELMDGYQIAKNLKLDHNEIAFGVYCEESDLEMKKWAEELNPDIILNLCKSSDEFKSQIKKAFS